MSVSQRILSGSKTRGSTVVNLATEGNINNDYGTGDPYQRDGWNSISHDDGLLYRIKCNASDIVLYDGKSLGEKFDDTVSVTFKSVRNGMFYFGNRRQTTSVSHVAEKRDLGYSSLFDSSNDFVETVSPEDPVEIISTHPYELYLPAGMVDFSSQIAKDGAIEPLDVRSKIDRSSIDAPFFVRGIRGSLANETPFRRTALIHEGYNLKDSPTVPYLDAPEYFGPVEIPPVFQEDNMTISPFTDTNNNADLYFAKKSLEGYSVSSDIVTVLISGSSFNTSDMDEFDIYGRRGTDYFGGGTDSIAFGGLLK